MGRAIERAAVVGAGVMGSALAAHLANAGIRTLLLDILPPAEAGGTADRNALATRGVEGALRSRPAAFFTPHGARRITVGNLEDDLDALGGVDWVLEAVVERLDVKESLFERIAPHLAPDAILSTNTSGLPVAEMAAVLPEGLRPRFFGTHFFNPPRYLHLLELVPHAGTDQALLESFAAFGERVLGKGIVVARDTPNFIANRVGGFTVMSAIHAMLDGGYTVEEVDALTGPLMGRPKSATFRTADLVGVDVLVHAAGTVYERATADPWRATFGAPAPLRRMVEEGRLGRKAGRGFYQKVKTPEGSDVRTLDLDTFEYRERRKPEFAAVDRARALGGIGERIRAVLAAGDRAAEFLWRNLSETLLYAAGCLDEIADDIVAVDRAMRWGYGWTLGPFELWDAVGVEATAERMKADGRTLPPIVEEALAGEGKTFYGHDGERRTFVAPGGTREVPARTNVLDLAAVKARGSVIRENAGASLIDVGDGVLCLEFHAKMNAIGNDVIAMMHTAVRETESGYEALVVGNEADNFSVGANLMLLLLEAQDGNWEEVELMVRSFQKANMALKYCRKPVVAAPFGMTLAGGCEVVLGAGHAAAAAETYMGLVEVGVGLIPAGGGCKEFVVRLVDGMPPVDGVDPFPFARAAFETIGMARVSTSGEEARDMHLLRPGDVVVMNREHLLHDAKELALGLARAGYRPPDDTRQIPVAGEAGISAIETQLYNMKEGGRISEYDAYLGGKLARVLCGGPLPAGTPVAEQYLLDLEREVFLHLCGQPKTHERIRYMLKHGKPLRN